MPSPLSRDPGCKPTPRPVPCAPLQPTLSLRYNPKSGQHDIAVGGTGPRGLGYMEDAEKLGAIFNGKPEYFAAARSAKATM